MTWVEWLNSLYWWPVVLIVGGALSVAGSMMSRLPRISRAAITSVGSIAIMTGLATMTLFLWGIGAIWLMIIVGSVLSIVVWVAWKPSRVLGIVFVVLTNALTVALITLLLAWSSEGMPLPGSS